MTDPVETFVTLFLVGFIALGFFIMRSDYKLWKDLKETRESMTIREFLDTFGDGLRVVLIGILLYAGVTIL